MIQAATDLLTTAEVAQLVGITDRTMRHWRRAGLMPEPLRSAPYCIWLRKDVDAWLPLARRQLLTNLASRGRYPRGGGYRSATKQGAKP